MIHSAIPTVSPVATIVFCCFVLLDLKSGDERTDNMCENNDHYRPWLWVGRVDQQWQTIILLSARSSKKHFTGQWGIPVWSQKSSTWSQCELAIQSGCELREGLGRPNLIHLATEGAKRQEWNRTGHISHKSVERWAGPDVSIKFYIDRFGRAGSDHYWSTRPTHSHGR